MATSPSVFLSHLIAHFVRVPVRDCGNPLRERERSERSAASKLCYTDQNKNNTTTIMTTRTPFAYFITLTCHGTRLHGSKKGNVDRNHNIYGTPRLEPSEKRYAFSQRAMKHPVYNLDQRRRKIALNAIINTCKDCSWELIGLHVRSNHIHLIARFDESPEFFMKKVKRDMTYEINKYFPLDTNNKKWSRHGSTEYIWDKTLAYAALNYVLHEQGEPMARYVSSEYENCNFDDLD